MRYPDSHGREVDLSTFSFQDRFVVLPALFSYVDIGTDFTSFGLFKLVPHSQLVV